MSRSQSITDFNSVGIGVFYVSVGSSCLNTPGDYNEYRGWLVSFKLDNTTSSYRWQVYNDTQLGKTWERTATYNGTWSDWKERSFDIPSFYKDYNGLASLGTALGVLQNSSSTAFNNIDDILGGYFVPLGGQASSWGSPLEYGTLVSFHVGSYTIHIAFPHKSYYGSGIKYRMHNGDAWGEWKTISLT